MKLWTMIRGSLLSHPDRQLCEGDRRVSYRDLCAFAEVLAPTLGGSCYGILCRSELNAAMALLACIAAGKTAVPLPYRYGKEVYTRILDRIDPPDLFTDPHGALQTAPREAHRVPPLPSPPPAVVLFTSGSTGTPKGVMLSEENLTENVQDILTYFRIETEDRILIARPLYHASVLTGEFLAALCRGAEIRFSSEPFQPMNLLRLMRQHGITVLGNTPTLLALLARWNRGSAGHTLRLLSVSGECMTEGMAETIRQGFPDAAVYCGYGLSEASPRLAYLPSDLFDHMPTAAGIPLAHVRLRIMGEEGEIWDSYRTGEVWAQGPNVMIGYFDDARRTRTVLRDGWLRTGDLAYWDSEGLLCVQGRAHDLIIRAGMNIYPAEIENALSTDPRVTGVMAYGFASNGTQEVGLTVSGAFADEEEVLSLCRAKLPPYQIPAAVRLVEDVAVHVGGKKKRRG